MSNLTTKQAWYQRNKDRVKEKARKWRLDNLDRYRQLQKAAKARKRDALKQQQHQNKWTPSPNILPFAPEGWDSALEETIADYCRRKGIPNDPKFW